MNQSPPLSFPAPAKISRRAMLREAACGFGFLGLAGLLAERTELYGASANPLAPRAPHFEPKAKRVIFLFMHGGPSSVDILDPKHRLIQDHGKPLPIKRPLAFDRKPPGPLMKPLWEFRPEAKAAFPSVTYSPTSGTVPTIYA